MTKTKKYESEKDFEDIKKEILFRPLDWMKKKFPRMYKYFMYGVAILSLVFIVILGFVVKGRGNVNDLFAKKTPQVTPTMHPRNDVKGESTFKEKINEEIVLNKCMGSIVEISDRYLEEIGGERFEIHDNVNGVVSAPNDGNYQATYETPWECNVNSTTVVALTPTSGESLGFYYELKDVYSLIIGDGDRITTKVQTNDSGLRNEWADVGAREKLTSEIEDDKEVIVKIANIYRESLLYVHIEVFHSGRTIPDIIERVIDPQAVNLNENQYRKARLGIKDWRFKGDGSYLKFDTLSITETK